MDLITGLGAKKFGGRWNPQGEFPAVYGSLEPETALAESIAMQRYYGIPLHLAFPLVMVAIEVVLHDVLDLSDPAAARALRVNVKGLAQADWRQPLRNDAEPLSQAVGWAAHSCNLEGLLVPSGSVLEAQNLLVFPDNLREKSRLKPLVVSRDGGAV